MKKLDVPLILQPEGSVDCIPTCVQMVLAFYGVKESLENLKSKLYYSEIGTTIYDNAVLLLQKGFKTKIITAQPRLFPPEISEKIKQNEISIKEVIQEKKKNENETQVAIMNTMIKYIDAGGEIALEIPSVKHIRNAIVTNCPIISLGYAKAIGENEGEYHAVVVNGFDDIKQTVLINNPWPNSKHSHEVSMESFLFSLHSSTCVDVDNGSLLVVSK